LRSEGDENAEMAFLSPPLLIGGDQIADSAFHLLFVRHFFAYKKILFICIDCLISLIIVCEEVDEER